MHFRHEDQSRIAHVEKSDARWTSGSPAHSGRVGRFAPWEPEAERPTSSLVSRSCRRLSRSGSSPTRSCRASPVWAHPTLPERSGSCNGISNPDRYLDSRPITEGRARSADLRRCPGCNPRATRLVSAQIYESTDGGVVMLSVRMRTTKERQHLMDSPEAHKVLRELRAIAHAHAHLYRLAESFGEPA